MWFIDTRKLETHFLGSHEVIATELNVKVNSKMNSVVIYTITFVM